MELTYEEIEEMDRKYDESIDKWLRNHCKRRDNTEGYVYLIKCADKYKIGYTKDVDRRFKELDTRPFPCELIESYYSDIAFPVEQKIHELLSEKRVAGEWYSLDSEASANDFIDFVYHVENKMLKWG